MTDEIKKIAVRLFESVLGVSADHGGTFRLLVTAQVGEVDKPLLVLGNAHRKVEDGHCIAILNPNKDLLDKVTAGCSYMGSSLKDIVAGNCDAMIELWIDAYKKDGVCEISTYNSRSPQPAKFSIE